MKLTDGKVEIPKEAYRLHLNFQPWLAKLAKHNQYVLLHAQDRPMGQQQWGVLAVNDQQVDYYQAVKVESIQPHDCWTLSTPHQFSPVLAIVYPACTIGRNGNGKITIESIGFMENS